MGSTLNKIDITNLVTRSDTFCSQSSNPTLINNGKPVTVKKAASSVSNGTSGNRTPSSSLRKNRNKNVQNFESDKKENLLKPNLGHSKNSSPSLSRRSLNLSAVSERNDKSMSLSNRSINQTASNVEDRNGESLSKDLRSLVSPPPARKTKH